MSADRSQQANPFDRECRIFSQMTSALTCRPRLAAALCSQVPVQVGPASVARRLHLFERQQLHSSLGEPDSLFAHGTHAKITGQKQWRGCMKLVPLRSTERDR